jgi:hypothetical protein
MKRTIILIIVSILLITIGVVLVSTYYRNYRYKTDNRQTINDINLPSTNFIFEGVYKINATRNESIETTDQFGVSFKRNVSKEVEGELSFTEQKLTIICEGIRDEIKIGPIEVYDTFSSVDSSTLYIFDPLEYKVYDKVSNACIFQLDTSRKDMYGPIELLVQRKYPPKTELLFTKCIRLINDSYVNGFSSTGTSRIQLASINYYYNRNIPKYAKNSKHSSKERIYNLE